MVGADRSDCLQHLIEKVVSKINGWKEKLHSMGGKEVLLKVVAQSNTTVCDDSIQNSEKHM
jgi:hypothetical protein